MEPPWVGGTKVCLQHLGHMTKMAAAPIYGHIQVVGSNPGRAIPKALKMVPVATLLGAQYYKASTGFSSPNKHRTTIITTLTKSQKKVVR